MTNNSNQPRVKPGIPTGGRWVTDPNDEDQSIDLATTAAGHLAADALLDAAHEAEPLDESELYAEPQQQRFTPTSVHEGSRTPWGKADVVTDYADGITRVHTPSHGGIKLSPDRNKLVHPSLRNSSAWYEEDGECTIVDFTFPEETRPSLRNGYTVDTPMNEHVESSRRRIRDNYPDAWEKITGRKLQPGESYERDRANWASAHANDFVMTSASTHPDDRDTICVTARKASTGEEARFNIGRDAYDQRRIATGVGQDGRLVINMASATRVEMPEPEIVPEKPRFHGINIPEKSTSGARAQIQKDLTKRWRVEGGRVATLEELVTDTGITDKVVYVEDGKRHYAVGLPSSESPGTTFSLRVSKATWAVLDAPDDRTPRRVLYQDREILQHQLDKLNPGGWNTSFNRARDEQRAKLRKQIADVSAQLDALPD